MHFTAQTVKAFRALGCLRRRRRRRRRRRHHHHHRHMRVYNKVIAIMIMIITTDR